MLCVTLRATYTLSPITTATMVIRGMPSRMFIGLWREVFWTCGLDEDKQG